METTRQTSRQTKEFKARKGRDKKPASLPANIWLSQSDIESINDHLHGEARIIFQTMIAVGWKFREIKSVRWNGYSSRLNTLWNNEKSLLSSPLSVATKQALLKKREQAQDDSELLFKMRYKYAWHKISTAFFKAGVCQKRGVLRRLRYTYCRLHFQSHKDKSLLKKSLGIKSLRRMPKEIFVLSNQPGPALIQFKEA